MASMGASFCPTAKKAAGTFVVRHSSRTRSAEKQDAGTRLYRTVLLLLQAWQHAPRVDGQTLCNSSSVGGEAACLGYHGGHFAIAKMSGLIHGASLFRCCCRFFFFFSAPPFPPPSLAPALASAAAEAPRFVLLLFVESSLIPSAASGNEVGRKKQKNDDEQKQGNKRTTRDIEKKATTSPPAFPLASNLVFFLVCFLPSRAQGAPVYLALPAWRGAPICVFLACFCEVVSPPPGKD